MTTQEDINRKFAEEIAVIRAASDEQRKTIDGIRAEILVMEKELRNSQHDIRNSLHNQALLLSRIEAQLQPVVNIHRDVYGGGNQPGVISRIQSLEEFKELPKDEFVTQAEFEPFKKLMSATVGICLAGILGALLALVLKTH